MSLSSEKSDSAAVDKKIARDSFVSTVSICILLSFYAAFSLSALSDGFACFRSDRLAWCGALDAVVVAGFLLGLKPYNFLRFAAFSIVGFSLYLGWSSGGFESVSTLKAVFADTFFMVAGLHAAAGILSFRLGFKTSAAVAVVGISFWHLPILLTVYNCLL